MRNGATGARSPDSVSSIGNNVPALVPTYSAPPAEPGTSDSSKSSLSSNPDSLKSMAFSDSDFPCRTTNGDDFPCPCPVEFTAADFDVSVEEREVVLARFPWAANVPGIASALGGESHQQRPFTYGAAQAEQRATWWSNVAQAEISQQHGSALQAQHGTFTYPATQTQIRQRRIAAGEVTAWKDMTQAEMRQQRIVALQTASQGDPTHAGRPATQ